MDSEIAARPGDALSVGIVVHSASQLAEEHN